MNVLYIYIRIYIYIWYHMILHMWYCMILYDIIWVIRGTSEYMRRVDCIRIGGHRSLKKNNCIASEALSAHRKRQHSSWKRLGKSAHFHAVVHLCPFVESTFLIFWLLADFQPIPTLSKSPRHFRTSNLCSSWPPGTTVFCCRDTAAATPAAWPVTVHALGHAEAIHCTHWILIKFPAQQKLSCRLCRLCRHAQFITIPRGHHVSHGGMGNPVASHSLGSVRVYQWNGRGHGHVATMTCY